MARQSKQVKKTGKRFRDVHLRAQWWDYENEGHYFITFCTGHRIHFLGEIKDGNFFPSNLGQIANAIWNEIPKHFPFIELGAFVVMPDHIHGILSIKKNLEKEKIEEDERDNKKEIKEERVELGLIPSVGSGSVPSVGLGSVPSVGSGLIPTPQKENGELFQSISKKGSGGITGIYNPMTKENISRVLRWYKGRCTFEMRKLRPEFRWQSKFYDRMIRDHSEYYRIERYILNNPKYWGKKKKNYPL